MTLGDRLKTLRRELGLSQEAFGAQGFVSAPGWIKIENGQRQASEKLIERLAKLAGGRQVHARGRGGTLKEELLTLKYLGSRSAFVREMAKSHAKKLPSSAVYARRRGTRRVPGQAEARPSARHELQEALKESQRRGCRTSPRRAIGRKARGEVRS